MDNMDDVPVEVVITTRIDGHFEDYLPSIAAEKKAEEPTRPQHLMGFDDAALSKEIELAEDDGKLPRALIQPVTGLEIPYPPGAETPFLREFGFQFDDDVEHLVVSANRVTAVSTAEIAANSPRYRRRSSTFIDGVHDVPDENSSPMAPAQLYSTMSGRLFHSGRIAIVLVGPPARGKT
jgi:hypothetical protein